MEETRTPGGVSISPLHERSASMMSGVSPSPPTLDSTTMRLPSVTPPKPPPPYSNCPEECEAINVALVKQQLGTHFKKTGIEGIAMKYESSITEAAALRRQVHSLKLQLGKPDSLAFDPLPMNVTESPMQSPKRMFRNEEEEEMWKAMNVDVLTKLDAIDKVERIKQEYEDTQRELRQELVVKEEVLAMLTEQMKSMIDRGQFLNIQKELEATFEQLQVMKREKGLISRQRDEACMTLQTVTQETEWKTQEAVAEAVKKAQELHAKEVLSMNDAMHQAKGAAIPKETLEVLEEQLRSSQMALAAAHKQLDEKEQEIARSAEVQKQLESKEEVVRELADSLQAQALAHKQTLTEAQERETKIESLTTHRQKSLEVVTTLQKKLEEREAKALRMAGLLEEKEHETQALQNQLAGFTDHLRSHLLQKDEQMKRAEQDHTNELKMTHLKHTELETRASVLQTLLDQKSEAARMGVAIKEEELVAQGATVDELREQNQLLSSEIANVRHTMEESFKVSADIVDRQLRTLQADCESLQRMNAKLEDQLNERNDLVTEQQENIASLQARLLQAEVSLQLSESLTNKNAVLEVRVQELESRLGDKERQCMESEESLREMKSKGTEVILNLTSQLDDAEQKNREQTIHESREQETIQSLREHLSYAESEIARLTQEAATSKQQDERSIKLNEELESSKESFNWLSKKVEEVSAQLTERDTTISSFKAACEEKDETIRQLRALLQKSSDALDLLQNSAQASGNEYSEKLVELTEDMQALQQTTNIKDSELEALNAQITALSNSLDNALGQNEQVNAKILLLEQELQQKKSVLLVTEAEKTKLARFLEDSHRDLSEKSANREAHHKNEVQSYKETLIQLEAHKTKLERDVVLYDERVHMLEESALVTKQLHIIQQEDLVSRLMLQEEALVFECIRLTAVAQTAALREKSLVAAIREKERVESELRALDEQSRVELVGQAKKKEEELGAVASQMRGRVSSLEEVNAKLQQGLCESKSREAQLKQKTEGLEQELSNSKKETHEATLKLEEARRSHAAQIQEMEIEQAARDSAIKRLQGVKTELQAAAGGKEKLLYELSNRMDEKSADVHSLHVALEESVQQVNILREQLNARDSEYLAQSQALMIAKKEAAGQQVGAKQAADINAAKIEALRKEMAECAHRLSEKNEEVLVLSAQVVRLEEEVVSAKSLLSAEKGESNVKSLSLQGKETESKRLTMQLESLRNALAENDKRLIEKTAELEHQRLDKEEALSKHAAALADAQSAGLEKTQQNCELAAQLEIYKRAARQAGEAGQAAQMKLEESCKANESMLQRAERRIELLQEQLTASGTRERELHVSSEAETQKIKTEYESTVSILKCDLTAKEAALRNLQQQLDGSNKNTVSNEYAIQAEKALTALTEEVQRLRSEAMNKDETLRRHGSVADMHTTEVVQLRTALSDEVARVTRLNQEVLSLHKHLGETQTGSKLTELKRISDELAKRYKEIEAMFCTPFITPNADGWDGNVAAAFIRTVKQWCIDYCEVMDGRDVPHVNVSPARISPPRSKGLLATVAAQPLIMPKAPSQEAVPALSSRSVNATKSTTAMKKVKPASKAGAKPAPKKTTRPFMR